MSSALALPASWQRIPLKYLLRQRDMRGLTHETVLSVYRDHGVVEKASRDDNFNRTPEDLGNYKLVRPGDFVVNKMKAWQGSVAVSEHRGIVSGDYLVAEFTQDVDRTYYHYLLRSVPLVHEYRIRSVGVRPAQWRLYWDDLRDIEVPVPPKAAQRTIGQFLNGEIERIDRLAEKRTRLITLLDELRSARIYHLVKGADGIPTPISYLARYENGRAFKPAELGNDGVPVIRIRQLNDPLAPVDYYDGPYEPRHEINDGDLIFSWSASLSLALWERGKAVLNQHLFKVTPAIGVSKAWLRFALHAAIEEFESLMHGSAMTHLTLDKLKQVKVPRPDASDQERIARELLSDHLNTQRLMAKAGSQLDKLAEYRQALITAAVSGQVDVSNVADQPEEAIA